MVAADAAAKADATQFVTLGVDGEVFAVEVEAVHEILDLRPVARMPSAPPYMLGLIDVRGQSVPVLDLRVKLGLAAKAATHHTRILVLDARVGGRPLTLGLLADQVFEVTGLDNGRIEPPPEIGVRWRSDYIRGVGRRNGGFVIVFDLGRLLTGEEAALLDGASAG
jgi:purine-binding chemotaxis protein CheW